MRFEGIGIAVGFALPVALPMDGVAVGVVRVGKVNGVVVAWVVATLFVEKPMLQGKVTAGWVVMGMVMG